jgi:hypothetical protein
MRPLSTRHTRALQSAPTLHTIRPSRGEKHTLVTEDAWPRRTRMTLPVPTCSAKRVERNSRERAEVGGANLPYPDQRISAGGDESPALDRKAHVAHSATVPAFSVAHFLNYVVGGAFVQQHDTVSRTTGGAASAAVGRPEVITQAGESV